MANNHCYQIVNVTLNTVVHTSGTSVDCKKFLERRGAVKQEAFYVDMYGVIYKLKRVY